MKPESRTFYSIKEKILNSTMFVFFILIFPLVLSSVIRYRETGWLTMYTVHIVLFVLILLAFFLRNILSQKFKVYFFLLVLLIPTVMGFLKLGLLTNAKTFILLSAVLIVLFLNLRVVYYYIAFIFAVLVLCAVLFHSQRLHYPDNIDAYLISLSPWINLIFNFFLIAIIIVFIVHGVIQAQEQTNIQLTQNEARYKMLFNGSTDAIFVHRINSEGKFEKYLEVNDEACKRLGYTREELLDLSPYQTVSPFSKTNTKEIFEIIRKKQNIVYEQLQRTKDGKDIPVEMSSRLFVFENESIILSVARDISERKKKELLSGARYNILEYSTKCNLNELLTKTLDEIERITDSNIGFYHFLEPDQNTLVLQAWSTNTMKNMCKAETKNMHYNIDSAGVWVDCVKEKKPVIHNDYSSLPNRKGMPEGHAPVIRELVVPVFRDNKIVAIIGVGNKPANYDNRDLDLINEIADLSWDIVENKIKEEALIESENRFRSIIEQAADAVFLCTAQAKIIDVNKQACRILGYSRDELLTKTIMDLDDSVETYESLDTMKERIKPGKAVNIESKYVHKNGSLIPFEVNISCVDIRGKTHYLGFARDISKRKTAERDLKLYKNKLEVMVKERTQELLKSETMRSLALEAANIGSWNCQVVIQKGNVEIIESSLVYDKKMLEILDVRHKKELRIKDWINLIVEEKRENSVKQFMNNLMKKGNFRQELKILDYDKRVRYILLYGKVSPTREKSVVRVDGLVINETTEKLISANLKAMLIKEKELNKLKSNFVSMASHQFRTPLTTIRSNSDLIKMYSSKTDSKIEPLLKQSTLRIDEEISKLNDLISDVMLLGKAGAEKIPFKPELTDFVALTQKLVKETKFIKQNHRVVEISVTGQAVRVLIDRNLMQQILSNLLSNAFKYSDNNPVLLINFKENEVIITISDQGIGIPDQVQKNVFQEFFRAENAQNIQGSGLGLVIAKEYIDLHGGKIEFNSKENVGSEFIFTIPIKNK
ncbi:MAG: PAS domain S-box protein [Bacteroidales bacterium]|nr:PAS domain S-box protein [Bacteroidales bacterium]